MSEADFAWLTEHSVEIHRQYAGKWIAVYDGRVIAFADTATEVARLADEQCPQGGYLLEAVERETDTLYACLCLA